MKSAEKLKVSKGPLGEGLAEVVGMPGQFDPFLC